MATPRKPRIAAPLVVDPTSGDERESEPAPPPGRPLDEHPDGGEPADEGDVGDMMELADPSVYREWIWWVYRMRTADELQKNPRARQRVVVTKVVGPLDILDVQARFGAGVYEFRGFYGGHLQLRREFELAAPPAPPTPPSPSPIPSQPSGNGQPEILSMLAKQQEQLARLEARLNTPTPAPAAQGLKLSDLKDLLALVRPAEPSINPGELLKEITAAFKSGAELRGEVEGGGEKSVAEIAIEKLAPAAERIATALLTRRPPPPARAPVRATARPASEAEVVEPTPTATAPTPEPTSPSGENYRIMAAVDALARAIDAGDEPGDFAATLEQLLDPNELAWLAGKTADSMLGELAPITGRYPTLGTEAAREFIDSVLTELRDTDAEPGAES